MPQPFTKVTLRDSNMELLRIIAMVIIMFVHANFRALGHPTPEELACSPSGTFVRYLWEGLCILGVNVFVILSGWYGIRFKLERLGALAFQILFFIVIITIAECIIEQRWPNKTDIGFFLLKDNYNYWFIKAYLMMYIMAPVMNSFVESASNRQFRLLLYCFFAFTFLYGWLLNGAEWLKHGYSGLSFMGLYLLARYLRLYASFVSKISKATCLVAYFSMALLTAILAFFMLKTGHQSIAHKLFYYTCPLVIAQASFFVILFSKISLKNNFINWVASSILAVYLTHSSSFVAQNYYDGPIFKWFSSDTTSIFCLKLIALVFMTFWISILLDKVRLYIWNSIMKIVGSK